MTLRRLALALCVASAPFAASTAPAAASPYKRCSDVLVRLQPEGEGGAGTVRVRGATCKTARVVLRRCILNGPPRGWKIRVVPSAGRRADRTVLSRGSTTIRFTFAGGGLCAPEAP